MKYVLINILILLQSHLYSQTEITINTSLNNDQRDPKLVKDGSGNLLAVWTSLNQLNDNSGEDIFMQQIDNSLNKIGSEIQVNDIIEGSQVYPSVDMNEQGDFVIAWSSFSDFNSIYDIKAKVFKNGAAVTNEFLVNTFTANSQTKPSVDIYSDGSFVIVWESWFQDGSDRGIFGQRFSSDGNKIGSEFQINTHSDFSQARPVVKYFADGKFVVVWESWKQDNYPNTNYGVYARVFNYSGEPITGEIQINDFTQDYQWYADVITLDQDKFVTTWCSWEQDGADGGIYMKLFGSSGQPLSNEILVNSTIRYYQWLPKLAKTQNNNIIVIWSSWQQDGSREGIYTKIYDSSLNEKSFEEKLNIITESFQWEPNIAGINDDEIIAVWSNYDVLNKNYDIIGLKKKLLLKEALIKEESFSHPSGFTTSTFVVNVIDSTQLTGDTYEISFSKNISDELFASIKNKTTNEILITEFYINQGEDLYYITPVFEGIAVEIKPVLKLELDFQKSYSQNNSGSNIIFNFVKPSGTTVIAPIDLVLIWGDPSKNSEGNYISPIDSAYSSSGKMEIKVPFTVKNLANQNRLFTYVIEPSATKNKQWDPGESIIILTPSEYQITFPNFHVQLNNTAPSGNIFFPLPGDSIFIFTRRPITTEDVFTFSTDPQYITLNDDQTKIAFSDFSLSQNFPNPFNSQSTFFYSVPYETKVEIKVYDILGRELKTLVNEQKSAGTYRFSFNAKNIPSGVYFYTLQSGSVINTKKMLILK